MAIGADWKRWLAFVAANFGLAWATFRLLRHQVRRFLLLRSVIFVILLLGVAGMGFFGVAEDRPRLAVLAVFGALAAGVILGEWWRRLSAGELEASRAELSDLVVTWGLAVVALALAVYAAV